MARQYDITAVIYDRKGNPLSVGKNNYVKTHPLQKKHAEEVGLPHRVFLHAEIDAIIKCKNLKKAHKISVFRFNLNGDPMLAKPCPVCCSALTAVNIHHIEHT